jgi:uncharacterized protein (DUF1778 family)
VPLFASHTAGSSPSDQVTIADSRPRSARVVAHFVFAPPPACEPQGPSTRVDKLIVCRTMSGMGKTDRIEARVEPAPAERIRFAASLRHTSVSRFMVDAAAEKAEQVIAEASYTEVPSEYFDRLIEALDGPPQVIPALQRAAMNTALNPIFKQA